MKKLLLFAATLLFFFKVQAQTPTQIVTVAPNSTYVYVGSLTKAFDRPDNSQKLVVKIFGGSWFSDTNGETTFYISNRGGLNVRQVSLGSIPGGRLTLKAYKNGDATDFYLMPDPTDYTSFAVTAYSFGYALTPQFINITSQNTAPATTDISSSLAVNPILTTGFTGNIGIGIAIPQEKLSVNGNIRAKEIKVESANWPDYVFADDYKLSSLLETEQYIKANGRLPELPSAAEVEKDGIKVGEVNAMLLRKIEELTLHLIEKDKEIKRLEKLNDRVLDLETKMKEVLNK